MADQINIAGYSFFGENAAVICCHVEDGKNPVLLFSYDEDGDLQFLCGAENHTAADGLIVHLSHVIEWHPDLIGLPAVNMGSQAWREKPGAAWVVGKL